MGILGLLLIPLACTTASQYGDPRPGGQAAFEEVLSPDLIPAEWGPLVSATPVEGTRLSSLWFQDSAGVIRAVSFDHRNRQLRPRALVIRRQ
jgi:hypothetical protein